MDAYEWSGLSHYPTLRLRYGEDMSIKEIAEHVGISERTVSRRLAEELERYRAQRPHVLSAYAKLHKLRISLTSVNDWRVSSAENRAYRCVHSRGFDRGTPAWRVA
jgi:DNA-binding Lrp family transcriptional regulator